MRYCARETAPGTCLTDLLLYPALRSGERGDVRLFLQVVGTEACACVRVVGPWALALQVLLPLVAWLQEPAFLQVAEVGMVETAAVGAACGIALGLPAVWMLARWNAGSRAAPMVPPLGYGIAVALGVQLYLFCNLLSGIGLLILLGRPLAPEAVVPVLQAALVGGCLIVLPLLPWLPLLVGLRVPAPVRVALLLVLTAVLALGFCPNPADAFAQGGAKMGGLLLAGAGSLLLLAAVQPPTRPTEPLHAHRHPR